LLVFLPFAVHYYHIKPAASAGRGRIKMGELIGRLVAGAGIDRGAVNVGKPAFAIRTRLGQLA